MVLLDRAIGHETAEPQRTDRIGGDLPRRVGVFERLGGGDQLGRAVAQMHYTARPGLDSFGLSMPTGDDALVAAVVSDEVDAPLELCRSLRHLCPTILVTSDSSLDDRLAAARAGVDAIVRRPVNLNELHDWLEHFASQREDQEISILIVDDDLPSAELYAEALRGAGMMATVVSEPQAAIERIDAMRPDLILMDIGMPNVSGIELSRIIRQSRQNLSVPIVFFSDDQDTRRQLEARKYGGEDFIAKPVDLEWLVSLVRLRTERARALRSMIERDGLTGLFSHSPFKDRVAQELERCRRIGAELSFAMIDLDRFKQINDNYGHPVGDAVIRAAANLLLGKLRRIDVVGRYGGEEFGVMLLDTAPKAAAAVIEGLRQQFCETPFTVGRRTFRVTFSAGIAGSRNRRDLPQLIAAADDAVYAAKRNGRNRVALDPLAQALSMATPLRSQA